MTTDHASNDPVYARSTLRTIRMKRVVPPIDQITPGQIKALAQAAAKQNVRVLLSNGLLISPDGSAIQFPPPYP